MACSATRGFMSDDDSTMIRAMRWMDDCPAAVASASDRGGAKSANAGVDESTVRLT